MMSDWILPLTVLVISLLLTGVVRALALRGGLLDVPNQRSSHTRATPRGGGLGIVGAFLAGLLYLVAGGISSPGRFIAVLAAGSLLVAGVGFWDDVHSLSARVRLPVHLAAAALLVWGTGQEAVLRFGSWQPALPFPLVGLLLLLAVVWFLNLFNFMDGIDGLAASEGFFVAGSAGVLLQLGGGGAISSLALVLAAACGGFLLWNWPPARIFMGDVGSGFLGFALAALALQTSIFSSALPIFCWLILPGVFFADATLTLLHRVYRREKWYAAHRSHAYQHAACKYGHLVVTLWCIGINLLWLLPLALLCVIFPNFGGWFTGLAYLPLLSLAWRFAAGGQAGVILSERNIKD